MKVIMAVVALVAVLAPQMMPAQAGVPQQGSGCLFFRNTRGYVVQLELPREASGIWIFGPAYGGEDRRWVRKNGYLVHVDRDTILRITYREKTIEITLNDAAQKSVAKYGGWAEYWWNVDNVARSCDDGEGYTWLIEF